MEGFLSQNWSWRKNRPLPCPTPKSSVQPAVRMATLRATTILSAGAWVIWWSWLHPMFTMLSTSSGASQICPFCRKSGSIWCLRPPKSSLAFCKSWCTARMWIASWTVAMQGSAVRWLKRKKKRPHLVKKANAVVRFCIEIQWTAALAFGDQIMPCPTQQAKLDALLYNNPLEYAQLVLIGEIEHYLSLGCDHGRLEDWPLMKIGLLQSNTVYRIKLIGVR